MNSLTNQQPSNLESSTISSHLQVLQDPFEAVYTSLSPQERNLVEQGRVQILAERAIEIKGMIAGQIMGNVGTGLTQTFNETTRKLDLLIERVEATPSAQYAVEFGHRRRRQLAKNLERLEEAIADCLIKEVERSPYPDQPQEQKSRLRQIWEALTAPGDG